MSKRGHIVTGIIVGSVFLCCFGFTQGWFADDSGSDPETVPPSQYAIDLCQQAVLDELKAPSTAEFGEATVSYPEEGVYDVVGTVDSENSFGAMLRATYGCTARQSGDRWTVDALLIE